jgi:hypothetical protein
MAFATGYDGSTCLDAELDVTLDPLILSLTYHRPDGHLGVARVSRFYFADANLHRCDCVIKPRGGHEDTSAGNAGLTTVREPSLQREGNSVVEVGVVKDHRGRLATEFHGHALQCVGGASQDRLTNRR